MKAQFVYENIEFQRGRDPKSSLGLGIVGLVQRELEKTGRKWNGPISITVRGNVNGKLYQWSNPANQLDLTVYDNGDIWMEAIDSEDNILNLRYKEDIYNLLKNGGLIKFFDLEEWEYTTLQENVNFQRGRNPKRSMTIGHSKIYPEKVLFEEIHEYIENDGWPGWEEVTPIEWNWKEPTFKATAKRGSGLKKGSEKIYTFYLTEKEGVVLFIEYYIEDVGEDQSEFYIENFSHWIKILESEHTRHMEFNHGPAFESVNFQRGQDPKSSMGIGKAANPFVIVLGEREVDDDGYITEPLPEDHNQDTWFQSQTDDTIEEVLTNWEREIDGSWYFHGYMKDNPDKDDLEMFHAPEFNDEWVEFNGEKYYIPDHKEYWDKIY